MILILIEQWQMRRLSAGICPRGGQAVVPPGGLAKCHLIRAAIRLPTRQPGRGRIQ